jgi:uncharacterized cupin superfamily protein
MIINPENVPSRTTSVYPEQFQHFMVGRVKKALGNAAGLKNFGVNLVKLAPGSCSALRHWHTRQDEFIYVIKGEVTLITNVGEQILKPEMMAAFPAGEEDGHHLVNHSDAEVVYLEVGDRTADDEGKSTPNGWVFMHKDGVLYEK